MKKIVFIVSFGLSYSLFAAGEKSVCIDVFAKLNQDIARFGGETPSSPIQDMANTLLNYE